MNTTNCTAVDKLNPAETRQLLTFLRDHAAEARTMTTAELDEAIEEHAGWIVRMRGAE